MQLVQGNKFCVQPNEDPNAHLQTFVEICVTFKVNGASDETIKLRLFPFSLKDRARYWLNSLSNASIITWNQLVKNFLFKYVKTVKLLCEIQTFCQGKGETLYEVWEKFKELLRKCPHHGLQQHQQIMIFYNGLEISTMILVDGASEGLLINKYPDKAYDILEELTSNNYQSVES